MKIMINIPNLEEKNQIVDFKKVQVLDVKENQRIIFKVQDYNKLSPEVRLGAMKQLNIFFSPARCMLLPMDGEVSVVEIKGGENCDAE